MLTSTLVFHRRMGFSCERNRRLIALGCRTMLQALMMPETLGRLEASMQDALQSLCWRRRDASSGGFCAVEDCCLRSVFSYRFKAHRRRNG